MGPLITVDYEVACSIIGQLIGEQIEIVTREEARAVPDLFVIERALLARRALIARRDALQPGDLAAVRAILAYGDRERHRDHEQDRERQALAARPTQLRGDA